MLNKRSVTVVIPCKNEEKIISKTVKSIPHYVDEVIVVDNGSKDNSAKEAEKAGAVVFSDNRKLNGVGYGYAHLTGISNAKGDFIVGMDADDTYPSSEIKNIVEFMEKYELDVVSCNRLPLKNPKAISPLRRLGIYVLNLEVAILYGYRIKDILTGMWVIRATALPKLNLRMGDWNLSPEVKVAAIMHKDLKFAEYQIDHFVREKEPSKQQIWKTGIGHMSYIFKKRFTEDSKLGGFLYSRLINKEWESPKFTKNKTIFAL